MNWLVDSALQGREIVHCGNVGLMRLTFALSIMIKFFVETRRGHYLYFDSTQYLSLLYQIRKPKDNWLTQRVWRAVYLLKVPAAIFLFLGLLCKVSLIILIVSFFIELRIYFKYHSNFMLLLCIGLLFSQSIDSSFSISQWIYSASWNEFMISSFQTKDYTIVPLWGMMTVFAMYFFAALHKLNSPFLSGKIVSTTVYILDLERPSRKFIDFRLPDFLIRGFITDSGLPRKLLKYLMHLTVLLEFLIPIGFLFQNTTTYSIILGVILHVCFLFLLPTTLLDFSLATISTYLFFVPPEKLAHALGF